MQKCSFNSPYSPSTVNLRCVRQSSCVVATPHTLIRYDTSPPSWARFFANFWNSTNLFFFFSPLLHRFLQFRLFRCRTRSDLLDSLLLTLFRFLRILAPRQLPWILLTRTKFVKLFSFFFFSFPPASYTNSVSTNLLHSHPIFSTRVLRHLFPDFGFYFDPLISIFPVTAGVMYRKLRNAVKKNITSALSSSIPL